VVASLVRPCRRDDALTRITEREREVLALIAEGRSNAAVARRLHLTERTAESHVHSIFTKLDLLDSDNDHRRVLAVLAYLDGANVSAATPLTTARTWSGHGNGSRRPAESSGRPQPTCLPGRGPRAQ
jgi:DNA-binding CsgD family transcriptional regulator